MKEGLWKPGQAQHSYFLFPFLFYPRLSLSFLRVCCKRRLCSLLLISFLVVFTSNLFTNSTKTMADSAVDKKETVPAAEKEVEKPVSTAEVADEDSKQSENGQVEAKENGDKQEEDEDSKDAANGDSLDAHDACPVKRKSAAGDAPEGTPTEGASPEKKAKLEEKQTAEAESNGDEAKAAA